MIFRWCGRSPCLGLLEIHMFHPPHECSAVWSHLQSWKVSWHLRPYEIVYIDEYEQSSWKEPWGTPLRTREYLKLVISLWSIVSKVFAKSNYTTSTAVSFVLCLCRCRRDNWVVFGLPTWNPIERLVAAEQQASLEDRVCFFIRLRYCVWQSDWSIVFNEGVVTLLIDDLIQLIFPQCWEQAGKLGAEDINKPLWVGGCRLVQHRWGFVISLFVSRCPVWREFRRSWHARRSNHRIWGGWRGDSVTFWTVRLFVLTCWRFR